MSQWEDREDWIQVRRALTDSEWDFRTVEGISRETELDSKRVTLVIGDHRSEVRQAISRTGEIVYAHGSKPVKVREVVAQMQRFASKVF